MNELVSVVITTYKRKIDYVVEALESVLNQTYSPLEVILVDDNGMNSEFSDDLRKLCEKYENVRYLPNEKNSGAQVSRNNGIIAAKGNYVAFLDDDDIWRETKLEKQMLLFKDQSVGMVFCDGDSFLDGDKTKLGKFRDASVYSMPVSFGIELFSDYIGSTSQAVIRRDVFEKVGMFDPDMPARQDYEMWLRISKVYKIVGVPEKLLLYRAHQGERISTNWSKCRKSYLLLLEKYKADYESNKYCKSRILLRIFTMSVKMKSYFEAAAYLFKAIGASPRCVFDVLWRRITRKTFSEYYDEAFLCKLN